MYLYDLQINIYFTKTQTIYIITSIKISGITLLMSFLTIIFNALEKYIHYGYEEYFNDDTDIERNSELDTPLQTDSEPESVTEVNHILETKEEINETTEPDIQDMSSDDTIDNNTTSIGMQLRIPHNVYDNV